MPSLRCINEREALGEQRVRTVKRLSAADPGGLFTQHLPLEAADMRQGQVLLTDNGFSIKKIPICKFHKSCKE